ncbi:ferric-dicitrate binding protein FerR (iron transport regulator) [Pedobacter sp. AK017]|uniref:FecR family protein n=1 Tax=Pedobacter sp. AK017 TaxID=2723073 RepID=UPI001608E3E8|nr:FecR family protein [Pedobacter sp. AK017]MBB5441317.1 ferric-dicitrate binding protein FerR (iron transport regulator) [Pedobacter sp. AK017]
MEQDYSKERALLEKFNKGLTTPHENAQVNHAFNEFAKSASDSYSNTGADKIRDEIWAKLPPSARRPSTLIKRIWPPIAVVAAAVTAIVFGIWFYKAPGHAEFISASQDIAPGRNTATLRLANGKVIALSDVKTGLVVDAGSLRYNDGTAIAQGDTGLSPRSATGQAVDEVVMSTPRGGTYQIVLPDGSKVWLNAASSIKFPSSFSKLPKRSVELSGEAYFEVFKNQNQPFIVKSKGQQVEVLGTHFNIYSYADEGSVKTTLLEGSVNVNGTILKPNQQAVLNHNTIKVEQADAAAAVAWKNGYFRFNDENIASVMQKLSRWYDIEVQYQDSISDERYYGEISRFKNISQVLKMLERTHAIHFKVEGRRVIVMR